jgi:hypothetical protein
LGLRLGVVSSIGWGGTMRRGLINTIIGILVIIILAYVVLHYVFQMV